VKVKNENASMLKQKRRSFLFLPGFFHIIETFIDQLEKDAGKQFIITGQTYDGVSSMRFQTSGHVQARLSAWATYVYCRSHLLNLAIKEAVENNCYDSFDTLRASLVYIRDSLQRLEILLNSQKINGTSKRGINLHNFVKKQNQYFSSFIAGHTIPKPSKTRWTYNYEIVRFGVKHYLSIVQTLATISQLKVDGASDGKRYAIDLLHYRTVFEILLLKDILQPAMKFLRQIERRTSCMDNFAMHVEAAVAAISHTVQNFDFTSLRVLMDNLQQYMPAIPSTAHSTRSRAPAQVILTQQTYDEDELRAHGEQIVESVLQSLNTRFDREAKELIKNLSILSTPSNITAEELLQNDLIQKYTNEITYKHIGVDNKVYTRTDPPLLDFYKLKTDVHSFLSLTKDKNTITSILVHLANCGQEQASEWYRLYQVLATFAVGSNEAERSFSALRRIKSWQRNRISSSTVEICIKFATLAPTLTEEAIQYIIHDFISHPGRAKTRHITIFIEDDHEVQQGNSDED
jgi:hypothetical protein